MEHINIFVDCHVFDQGFQGTRTYLQGIYSEMITKPGFHFFLAANDTDNLKKCFPARDNITFIRYKYHNKFLRLLLDIPAICKKYGIDYAHFQYIVPPLKRSGYIVTTHDALFIDFPQYFPFFNRVKNTFLYRQGAKAADIRLTVSEYAKQTLEKHFGIRDYIITPNAVDTVFFQAFDKAEVMKEIKQRFGFENYIIYVSRWEPRKNQQLLLKAFDRLKLNQTHEVLFIGDNTLHNQDFHDVYDKLEDDVKTKVHLLDKLPYNDLILLVRGAAASVYPSKAEGFGIPPLEAVAANVPTICSGHTAMSDFSFFGNFLFDPYDQKEFESKLLRLLQTDVSSEMAEIRSEILNRYSWSKSAGILEEAIKKDKINER